MGGLHIELDNSHRSYFAGQVVAGRVVIQNAQPVKVKEITISLEGTGQVHWNEKVTYTETSFLYCSTHERKRIVTKAATETYTSLKTSLVGDGKLTTTTIPAGTTSYPFHFSLPKNLPSSFSSKIGEVIYVLTAEIKRSIPSFTDNDKARLPFTMNGLVDLNLVYMASLPQQCQKRMGSCMCSFRKGCLSFLLSITRSGFVPGEKIDFRVMMNNGGNRKVTLAKASLQQIAKFYARGQCKMVKRLIAEVRGPSVEEREHDMWETNLGIPPVPPTKLGGLCRIVDVSYCLQFEMRIFGMRDPLVGMIPVIIGTIPLRATFGDFLKPIPTYSGSSPGSTGKSDTRPSHISIATPSTLFIASPSPLMVSPSIASTVVSPGPPAYSDVVPSAPIFLDYPDLPPPSYLEAIGAEGFTSDSEGKGEGTESDKEYAPRNCNRARSPFSPTLSTPSSDIFVPVYVTYKRKGVIT